MNLALAPRALLAIGCVMARQCHLNTCPVGIATQDEKLRMRFNGKPEMVMAYFRSLAEEVRGSLAQLGVRSLGELRGWYDRLDARSGMDRVHGRADFVVGTRGAAANADGTRGGAEDSLHFSKLSGA